MKYSLFKSKQIKVFQFNPSLNDIVSKLKLMPRRLPASAQNNAEIVRVVKEYREGKQTNKK